jgi:hypothetical protein
MVPKWYQNGLSTGFNKRSLSQERGGESIASYSSYIVIYNKVVVVGRLGTGQ